MWVIVFSALAGIVGTGAGGLISAVLYKRSSEKTMCWMLSFAAGVMVSIVCFGLIPEAFDIAGMPVIVTGLVLGILTVMLLNRVVDKATETRNADMKVHHTYEEMYHESRLVSHRSNMLRSGMLMLIAIALHNIPEGIAIGASGSYDFQLGALLALMIALHNIPEGMAIASPLMAGGITRYKAVLLTALSGAPTLLGGLIGLFIGGISDFAVALSFSVAGGAMLYIVYGEIIPQSIVMTRTRTATVITLFGIIVGLIVTAL